jgi:hypothetical protein
VAVDLRRRLKVEEVAGILHRGHARAPGGQALGIGDQFHTVQPSALPCRYSVGRPARLQIRGLPQALFGPGKVLGRVEAQGTSPATVGPGRPSGSAATTSVALASESRNRNREKNRLSCW